MLKHNLRPEALTLTLSRRERGRREVLPCGFSPWKRPKTIGSVAAASDGKLLAELELNPQQRSAASLAPALQDLLKMVGWRPGEVQLVAATIGPGSFTGLRVGVTTAKTFAYAVGAEVLGVDTLQAIANGLPGETPGTVPILGPKSSKMGLSPLIATHACRSPWTPSAATWLPSRLPATQPAGFSPPGRKNCLPVDAWLAGLPPGTLVAGPVLQKLLDRLPVGVTAAEARFWHPRAAGVARLAAWLYAAGRRDDVWSLSPRYSRRSAAEEKWDKTRTEKAPGLRPGG